MHPKWSETENSRVGLFLPLPEPLAEQFPETKDKSPPHVTLLFVGTVPKARQEEFLAVVQAALAKEPGPIQARLDGVDYFTHPHEQRRVWYSPVRFSKDVAEIRDRVWLALEDAGFEVAHTYPLAYFPHVTLAYMGGFDSKWGETPPTGAWEFTSVEVWGLPKVHELKLGSFLSKRARSGLPSETETIPGGLAKGRGPGSFDPEQLEKGSRVEMEHTDDPAKAKEIAMDHLTEDPGYYGKLSKMEKKATRLGTLWLVEDPTPESEIIDILIEVSDMKRLGNLIRGTSDWGRRNPVFHDDLRSARADADARLKYLHGGDVPAWVYLHAGQGFKLASGGLAKRWGRVLT